ncbi:MAG: ATP-binding protein, partial [Nitrospirota bacterium]|nr:ATP-binding protein [Nitrospirota bacterium]
EGENIGNIVSANPAAAKMHGYSVGELLKLNLIKDLDTPEAAADASGRIQRMMNGEWIKAETTHRRKDGTVFPVEISAGLFDFMGHKYVLAFDRDITERKEFEESLKRAEQMKLVGEWAAGLAHEIKNSLAGIKISIELLIEDAAVAEEDRVSILKAIDEIKRIELLLKSLLSFARPSRLDLQTTNVNDILDNAISYSLMQSALSPGITDRITITKHLDETLPHTMADRLQLRQVFMNVLINACQAMQDGGELTVRTSHDTAAHEILIEISDTGEGIDGTIIDKIFQPFFTTKSRGTGLGLAITKRIVEQHGGRISIANRPGSGIVFDIWLPVNKGEKERNA